MMLFYFELITDHQITRKTVFELVSQLFHKDEEVVPYQHAEAVRLEG